MNLEVLLVHLLLYHLVALERQQDPDLLEHQYLQVDLEALVIQAGQQSHDHLQNLDFLESLVVLEIQLIQESLFLLVSRWYPSDLEDQECHLVRVVLADL